MSTDLSRCDRSSRGASVLIVVLFLYCWPTLICTRKPSSIHSSNKQAGSSSSSYNSIYCWLGWYCKIIMKSVNTGWNHKRMKLWGLLFMDRLHRKEQQCCGFFVVKGDCVLENFNFAPKFSANGTFQRKSLHFFRWKLSDKIIGQFSDTAAVRQDLANIGWYVY